MNNRNGLVFTQSVSSCYHHPRGCQCGIWERLADKGARESSIYTGDTQANIHTPLVDWTTAQPPGGLSCLSHFIYVYRTYGDSIFLFRCTCVGKSSGVSKWLWGGEGGGKKIGSVIHQSLKSSRYFFRVQLERVGVCGRFGCVGIEIHHLYMKVLRGSGIVHAVTNRIRNFRELKPCCPREWGSPNPRAAVAQHTKASGGGVGERSKSILCPQGEREARQPCQDPPLRNPRTHTH